jgi:hypothetical protein
MAIFFYVLMLIRGKIAIGMKSTSYSQEVCVSFYNCTLIYKRPGIVDCNDVDINAVHTEIVC